MSFLEEIDEKPRRTSPRRPPPRGPGTDQQTLWIRRLVALGAGVLVIVLIVVGIHGCLSARKKQAYRDYVRDVGALLQESDQESKELFDLLRNPSPNTPSPVDVTNNANGVRVQSEQLVDRAKGTSHPGELNNAQRYLVETLECRRDGIAAIGQFLPDIDWLRPNVVADRISRIRGGGAASQPATPGLHGTALGTVTVKPGGQTLSTGQAVAIPAGANTSFDVQVSDQGNNDESNVTVKVTITGAGKAINVQQRLASIAQGQTATVNVPLAQTPPTGKPVKITVQVLPVPGEKKTDNNKSTFPAIFTH